MIEEWGMDAGQTTGTQAQPRQSPHAAHLGILKASDTPST